MCLPSIAEALAQCVVPQKVGGESQAYITPQLLLSSPLTKPSPGWWTWDLGPGLHLTSNHPDECPTSSLRSFMGSFLRSAFLGQAQVVYVYQDLWGSQTGPEARSPCIAVFHKLQGSHILII